MRQLDRARRLLGRTLARAATRVAPPAPADGVPATKFYAPPASCQVVELAHLYSLLLGERVDGMAVEVGAFDGESFSNTSCLIDVGWSAVLLEPVPEFAERCRERYRGNERVRVLEVAAGAENSTVTMAVAGSLTSADEAQLAEYDTVSWAAGVVKNRVEITVAVRRLDDVLDECGVQPGFDLLVVDVEGYEAQVWDGFDLERWRPLLMIWELCDTHPDLVVRRQDSVFVSEQITKSGYRVVYKDQINTVFVRSDAPLEPAVRGAMST